MCSKTVALAFSIRYFYLYEANHRIHRLSKSHPGLFDAKKRTSAFTWRDFAKSAGFSSAIFLKYVCEGKKNLSRSGAKAVALAMGLTGFDNAYFQVIVGDPGFGNSYYWTSTPSKMYYSGQTTGKPIGIGSTYLILETQTVWFQVIDMGLAFAVRCVKD